MSAEAPTTTSPQPPANATPQELDEWWHKNVYCGDGVPQFTWRAVIMGGLLGGLMSWSNLYTTLKMGWSFGVAITACVVSFMLWKGLRAISGCSQMTMLENNCMQSTASSAGYSTGGTLATAFGAHLLITGQHTPWWIVAMFVLFVASLGVFLAIPLKRQMINYEQLPFPSGIAAAETVRSLYAEGKEAMVKAKILIWGLVLGGVTAIAKDGATLVEQIKRLKPQWEWLDKLKFLPEEFHFGWNNLTKRMVGFGFEPSLLLVAAGMIVGLRTSLTMLFSSLALHLGVAPALQAQDALHVGDTSWVNNFPRYIGGDALTGNFVPFRWALWGGCACMVMSSLTALGLSWPSLKRSFQRKKTPGAQMASYEVPNSWMVWGLIPVAIGLTWLMWYAFSISPILGFIAVLFSAPMGLVCCRAVGETDTGPIGALGKVTQLFFAILPGGRGQAIVNLMPAGVTAGAASSSADLLSDLKSGYLLGANPRQQFLAQLSGVFFGTLFVVPAWYLLVPDKAALEKINSPATSAWYATAQLLANGLHALPKSAVTAIIIGSIIGIILPILEKLFPKAKPFLPSAMGIGLAWIMSFSNAFAFALGAIIAWIWSKMNKASSDVANVPLASGVIAGGGLIAALIAISCTLLGLIK